jgi:hypothetical protein
MTRIFVSGFSPLSDSADLESLVSKVCKVSEVYIPPPTLTGLRRNFAVITIAGDSEEVKKCVKSFNGSVWKGAKLHFAVANEYYRDRLEKEKIAIVEEQEQLKLNMLALMEPKPIPPVTKEVISLRKIKSQPLPTAISMKPCQGKRKEAKAAEKDKRGKPKVVIVPCGSRKVFKWADDDDAMNGPLTSSEELESSSEVEEGGNNSDSDTESRHGVSIRKSASSSAETGTSGAATKGTGGKPAEVITILNKLNAGEIKPIGGGRRTGFGTIAAAPIPADVETALLRSTSTTTTAGAKASATNNGFGNRKEVDCCIEERDHRKISEHELHIPNYALEDEDDSGVDEPCLTEEDLRDETLQAERERALKMMDNVLFFADKKPTKKDKKNGKVSFNEENNTENAAASASDVQNTNSGEIDESTAIINEMKAKAAAATASLESAVTDEKGTEGEDVLQVKDGYANMSQFKNIFYREVRKIYCYLFLVNVCHCHQFASAVYSAFNP